MFLPPALAVATWLAAGSIVDVGLRSEGRTSFLSEPVAEGFGSNLTVVGLTPREVASARTERETSTSGTCATRRPSASEPAAAMASLAS